MNVFGQGTDGPMRSPGASRVTGETLPRRRRRDRRAPLYRLDVGAARGVQCESVSEVRLGDSSCERRVSENSVLALACHHAQRPLNSPGFTPDTCLSDSGVIEQHRSQCPLSAKRLNRLSDPLDCFLFFCVTFEGMIALALRVLPSYCTKVFRERRPAGHGTVFRFHGRCVGGGATPQRETRVDSCA